ncbi:MAG: lipoprotein-releasing system permease protein [Chthoniobacter sp.]|jgi:lipoprotein-releasing system permease protein|nr:lipoprotein-releasing system permease protein [Chthoniobacter sp.]
MRLPFGLFLALRYLKPKRTFVSVITIISVLGVTLGIAVLIVVISVMTGFDRSLQRAILGFEPHLRVGNGELLRDWREPLAVIAKMPHVIAVAPYAQGPVMVEHQGRVFTPVMRGIEVAAEQKLLGIRRFVDDLPDHGTIEMTSDTCVIGVALARELGVALGDTVTVYAPGNVGAIIEELKREDHDPEAKPKTLKELKGDIVLPAELKIVGIFNSGLNSYDSTFLLVPLFVAQELYGLGDGVHGLSIKTDDPYRAGEVQDAINERFEGAVSAVSWFDENRQRFDAIRMERHVMFVILMFLIIIAAFGITSTLITVTVQKTREIGIMKALGARTAQIIWVFLAQGMFVGFFGTVIGLVLGLTALYYRNPFREWLSSTLHMEIFPAGIYEFEGIPAEVVTRDVTVICISAFAICSVAALVPAWFAARLDPVKALRQE